MGGSEFSAPPFFLDGPTLSAPAAGRAPRPVCYDPTLGMFRVPALPVAFALAVLAYPSVVHAQAKDAFVQGLVDFINAAQGTRGDEGPALTASLDAMAHGLAEWDAAVARVEAGFAAEIGSASAPEAARMRTALGAVYLERGRTDAALEQFEAAARLDPTFGPVQLLRGLVYQHRNRVGEAETAFRVAWQQDAQNGMTAYLYLQTIATGAGSRDADAALQALSAAVEGATGEPLRVPALGLLDEATLSAPVFLPARYADASALLLQTKYAEALASLRDSAATDPLVIDRALRSEDARRAIVAFEQNAAAAITAAQTLVAAASSSSEAHRVLGLALWAGRRYDEAATSFRMAATLNPRDERSRLAIADVLAASGNPAGAREALGDLIRAIPDSAQAHWKLGRLHQTLGDEPSALRSFETGASMPSLGGSGHLHAAIGRLYHSRLDLDAAAAALARRVRTTPNDSAAHFDFAEVLRAQEQLPAALAEYLVAALLDPTSAKAFAMIGLVYASTDRDDEAVRMLRKAVTLDPGHLEARYGLSRALLRLGKRDEAQQELVIFQALQAKAMEEERRRFRENQGKIDETLKAGDRPEPGR